MYALRIKLDGGAWSVTKEGADCLEPMIPVDAEVAKRDAVRRVLNNREAVVGFALVGG